MRKYIIPSVAVFIAAGVSAGVYLFASHRSDTDVLRIEDAIIIRGISMETDEPPSEEDGQIIYDDSFDDAVIDYDRIREGGKTGIDNDYLARLKAKDSRWHLKRYRIRKNDNLWKIAKRFGVNHRLIIGINQIDKADLLKPGRYINIPTRAGVYYRVLKGDTVAKIAARYGVEASRIVSHNGIRRGSIRPGQRLFIPDAVERPAVNNVASRKKTYAPQPALTTFVWPMRGRITSGFGTRRDPFTGQRSFHCGIDISAKIGTLVRASNDGRVIFSGWKPGYGNVVVVRHEKGYITVYAHNSKNLVTEGVEVKRGEVIASSGATGAVTGAHLHFEVRKYLYPLNPLRILR